MDLSPDRILGWLRARVDAAVAFAETPKPLSGGFDTIILAFRLDRAPPEWSGPLILRAMTRADLGPRVRREAAIHAALVKAGFPAPRVLAHEPDPAPLGLPFLIIERLPGETMLAAANKARLAGWLAMPRRLAELHAQLHRVPGEALRDSARAMGVDPATLGVRADVERLGARIAREGLTRLLPGAEWLKRECPTPAQAEVICHGDFHPLNIMVHDGRLSGVIDWAGAAIAEPAYDLAGLRVIALHADPGMPAWARGPASLVSRLMVRHYMKVYRAASALDTRNLPYYEAIRLLSALAFAGEQRPQAGNPWNAPHTVATLLRQFERISGLRLGL